MTKTDPRPEYLIVIQVPVRLQQTACIPSVGILSLKTCNLMLIEWQQPETFTSFKITTSHRIGLRLASSKTNLYTRYRKENTFKCPFLKLFV